MRNSTRCLLQTGFLLSTLILGQLSLGAAGEEPAFGEPSRLWGGIASPAAVDYLSPFAEPTQKQAPCEPTCTRRCCLCPCAYGVVEALILERNVSGSSFPLALDATSGLPLVTTDDLDFPYSGGLRAYIGHRFCGPWAWELGYFGLFGANASADFSGDFTLPGDLGPGSNVFFGTDRLRFDYTSDVHSGELNFVCCSCFCCPSGCHEKCTSIEYLYGLRYLRADETLDVFGERDEVGGTETGSYSTQATNDLYGGQFGMRLRHCRGSWSVEGTGKAGLYFNDARQSQTIIDFPDFVLRQTTASADHLAFFGELNATLIRQISDHWFVRGGYNLMWIDGVALAPDQLDFSLTSTSGSDIDTGNTMFLHGINVGIEARW
jgi:hypothetical protein